MMGDGPFSHGHVVDGFDIYMDLQLTHRPKLPHRRWPLSPMEAIGTLWYGAA